MIHSALDIGKFLGYVILYLEAEGKLVSVLLDLEVLFSNMTISYIFLFTARLATV